MEIGPGTSIGGRYVVQHELGRGGFATVFAASHSTLGSTHALKVLHTSTSTLNQRLLSEGRAQAQLQHPNIVSVTDVVQLEEHVVLVMEFIDGPSLDALLAARRLTLGEVDLIVRALLSGVAAAHGRGLVHRDLKPANVLISCAGSQVQPKITDFGLVKVLDAEGAGLTASGVGMGTPAYMAPEQFTAASEVDERGDIYSLGCIFYELYSGRRATIADGVFQLALVAETGDRPSLSELAPETPPRLAALIEEALSPQPEDRPRSVAKMLERWTAASTSEADAHRTLTDLASGAGAASGRNPTNSTMTSLPVEEQATRSEPSRSGLWTAIAAVGVAVALVAVGVGSIDWRVPADLETTGEPRESSTPIVSDDPATQRIFERAIEHILNAEATLSKPLFAEVAEREPESAMALIWAATTTAPPTSFELAERARLLAVGDDPVSQLIRLKARSQAGDHDEEAWQTLMESHPELPFMHLFYSSNLRSADPHLMLAGADRYLAARPDQAAAHWQAARYRVNFGQFAESQAVIDNALELFPTSSGLLDLNVTIAALSADWPRVLVGVESALKFTVDDRRLRESQAVAHIHLGNHQAYGELRERLLRDAPFEDQVHTLGRFATTLISVGRPAEGFALYDRCIALAKEVDDAGQALIYVVGAAKLAIATNRFSQALEYVDSAVPLMSDPRVPQTQRDAGYTELLSIEAVGALYLDDRQRSERASKRLKSLDRDGRYGPVESHITNVDVALHELRRELYEPYAASKLREYEQRGLTVSLAMLALHHAAAESPDTVPWLERIFEPKKRIPAAPNTNFEVAALVTLAELGIPEQAERALAIYDDRWRDPEPDHPVAVRAEAARRRLSDGSR